MVDSTYKVCPDSLQIYKADTVYDKAHSFNNTTANNRQNTKLKRRIYHRRFGRIFFN